MGTRNEIIEVAAVDFARMFEKIRNSFLLKSRYCRFGSDLFKGDTGI